MKIAIAHKEEIKAQRLRTELSKYDHNQLIWIAHNIEEIIEKCKSEKPDLILMDLKLAPSGLNTISYVMKNFPCAILILACDPNQDAALIFEAMGQGAVDVINACFLELNKDFNTGFQSLLGKINVVGKLLGSIREDYKPTPSTRTSSKEKLTRRLPPLVLIGASTGGPSALAKLIKQFPRDPNFATIIIQHVDGQFTESLARWLSYHSAIPVQIAYEGSYPTSGKILLAGKNDHLIMNRFGELKYSAEPKNKVYHPSIDVFFESVLKNWPIKSVAMLLTGMGDDGALGLKGLHDAGWLTIAEHPNSCVVYGMPKAAVELNGVSEILPLDQMVPKLLTFLETIES